MGNLVITRRCGESVFIDGDIKVTVVSVQNNSVKLAINAPREREILREELMGNGRSPHNKRGS